MASGAVVASAVWLGGGCGTGFDSISKVDSLRVFSVVPEKVRDCEDASACLDGETCVDAHCRGEDCASDEDCQAGERCLAEVCRSFQGASYANPGDVVRFKMTYQDGFVDPEHPDDGPRAVQVAWLGGCYDPEGDQYFDCYEQIADAAHHVRANFRHPRRWRAPGRATDLPPESSPSLPGSTSSPSGFPTDIVSRRPKPPTGPHYGIAYIFFALCAGELRPRSPGGRERGGLVPAGLLRPFGQAPRRRELLAGLHPDLCLRGRAHQRRTRA